MYVSARRHVHPPGGMLNSIMTIPETPHCLDFHNKKRNHNIT